MTDRELLELAASAIGEKCEGLAFNKFGVYRPKPGMMQPCFEWNPIADDADALRLAVKLMEFEPYKSQGYLPCIQTDAAATRQAIVRAAAEIGRNMK